MKKWVSVFLLACILLALAGCGKSSKLVDCSTCKGSGSCNICKGTAEILSIDGYIITCTICKGSGQCTTCGGAGKLTAEQQEEHKRIEREYVDIINRGLDHHDITSRDICTACGGSGNGNIRCTYCGGSGIDPVYENTKGSVLHSFAEKTCVKCQGSGYERCTSCWGSGSK